jgi:hypothetical protein
MQLNYRLLQRLTILTPQKSGDKGYLFAYGCKISLVSIGTGFARSAEKETRNWLPLVLAAAIVLLIAAALILGLEHGNARSKPTASPISAPQDPYAGSLSLTRLAMSESSNLAGDKITYVDGHIANLGARTVTGVTVQVLFRNIAHEVTQNETLPLMLIHMREPYIDVEPVSAAPLAPGGDKEFRLIIDGVTPDWDGAYPEIRILRVVTK